MLIPVTLKRGGNFIEVAPGENFAELDHLDFLRIVRDTLPTNGFDNGICIRLTENDNFEIQAGGYAIFENVVTDSIKSKEVSVQVKNTGAGTLTLRQGGKTGDVLSKCNLSGTATKDGDWDVIRCSDLPSLQGVQDFYLTADGISDEVTVGNFQFEKAEPASSSSNDATAIAAITETSPLRVTKQGNVYTIRFETAGRYTLYVFNSLGQVSAKRTINGEKEIKMENLPFGNYIFRIYSR